MVSIRPRHDLSSLPEPTGSFAWVQAPWGWALHCGLLAAVAPHVFTTRDFTPAEGREADPGGWDRVGAFLGLPAFQVWRLQQVHGCATLRVDQAAMTSGAPLLHGDALLTTTPDVALAVKTADCVPILLADRRGRAVAAVHAGWRGTALRIAEHAVAKLVEATGGQADEIVAAVGPSIGVERYEVGAEVREHFAQHGHAATSLAGWFQTPPGGRPHLDLWRANRDQLVGAGLDPSDVLVAGLCTATHPHLFHSYRTDGQRAGRMLAVIRRSQ